MSSTFVGLIQLYAARLGADLPPHWQDANAGDDLSLEDQASLGTFVDRTNAKYPRALGHRPRAHEFPLLTYDSDRGWALAEQWDSLERVRVSTPDGNGTRQVDEDTSFYRLDLPHVDRGGEDASAFSIFKQALLRRKSVFISAIVATVTVNILTLATSLYSMQIYDRVIPRSGYSTLWVLTVGVIFALLIDFALKATRALMIEREAAKIDIEVSEFFFARAQAVRLDARPPSIGTMAAQIRGWEQIRSLLSSATIFLLADLPFAIFFIVVIASIGGAVAYVPMIAFPIALALAFIFARLIRKDTARAQISGNRKNGLLVESLDAAETIKSNRGSWHMLGRWNQLMEEVQLHEDPVKRWSSIATSIFGTMQLITYVLIVAWGAVLVTQGEMTSGGLIACAIIAGRVNGPLIAQLPGFLVQAGYARSSLQGLDAIMRLPTDKTLGGEGVRPEMLEPSLHLQGIQFCYPGASPTLDITDLRISAGEKVAIIGGIGSGKSTLLRVAAGLYAPSAGTIDMGGLEMSQIAPDILRQHVGYLPQDARLLNGTLRENVTLGVGNPGDAEIIEAAALTGLDSIIAGSPRGLDLAISEGGRGLSGGQRTIACLTRLILARPSLWLLDEPTGNLDQGSESKVVSAIQDRIKPQDTLILVTHRLQLLSMVNRVIVLAKGKVAMDGPTADVISSLKQNSQKAAKIRAVSAA